MVRRANRKCVTSLPISRVNRSLDDEVRGELRSLRREVTRLHQIEAAVDAEQPEGA